MGAAARRNSYEFLGIPLSGGARFDADAMWRDAALAYGESPYPHRRAGVTWSAMRATHTGGQRSPPVPPRGRYGRIGGWIRGLIIKSKSNPEIRDEREEREFL